MLQTGGATNNQIWQHEQRKHRQSDATVIPPRDGGLRGSSILQ